MSNDLILSKEEYEGILKLRALYNHQSFKQLETRIKKTLPRLEHQDISVIKQAYHSYYEPTINNQDFFKSNLESNRNILPLAKSTNKFLYYTNYPIFKPKKYNWTQYETNQLIYLLNNMKKRPKWGLLSLCFPGRNGQQLYTKFKELESHELIKPFNNTLNICQGAFIMNQELEEELAAVILQRYNNKTQTSLKWFRKYAQEFYFLPNSLAKTAAINHFKKMDLTFIKVMDIQNNL